MVFEIGKYYKHITDRRIHVIAEAVESDIYVAPMLIAETDYGHLVGVGSEEAATVNWSEISKEEWLSGLEE